VSWWRWHHNTSAVTVTVYDQGELLLWKYAVIALPYLNLCLKKAATPGFSAIPNFIWISLIVFGGGTCWRTDRCDVSVMSSFYSLDHSHPYSAEVKECVELYIFSPNTPSWRGA